MDKINQLKGQILFFKVEQTSAYQCQLNRILSFLRCQGLRPPLMFHYAGPDAPLIGNLTLKENIYLESLPQNMASACKESQFHQYLKQQSNSSLVALYESIPNQHLYPSEVDSTTRKMVALMTSLLRPTPYLIYERPENFLDSEQLNLFIKALKCQCQNRDQVVILTSPTESFWLQHAHQVVSQKEQHFEFQTLITVTEAVVTPLIRKPNKHVA